MSAKAYKAARAKVQSTEGQVLALRRKTRFYYPLWRVIVGAVFPSVKVKFLARWEAQQREAFAKVKKPQSHKIVKGAK